MGERIWHQWRKVVRSYVSIFFASMITIVILSTTSIASSTTPPVWKFSSLQTLSQASSDSPEQEPLVLIAEVVVNGVEGELQELVYSVIQTKSGETTSYSQLQNDVDAIFETGLFSNVRAIPENFELGVRVTFEVQTNPSLQQVVISLLPSEVETSVVPEEVVNAIFADNYGKIWNWKSRALEELRQWYLENGYTLANLVNARISNKGILTLEMAEGIIRDIQILFVDWEGIADEDENPIHGEIPESEILQILEIQSGDVFNYNSILAARQRLLSSGWFLGVGVKWRAGIDDTSQSLQTTVSLIIEVAEFTATNLGLSSQASQSSAISQSSASIETILPILDETAFLSYIVLRDAGIQAQEQTKHSLQEEIAALQQVRHTYSQEENRTFEGITFNLIGERYYLLGERQEAINAFNSALNIWDERDYEFGKAITLNGLGIVYQAWGNIQQALDAFNRSLEIWREVNNQSGQATALTNIGEVYHSLGDTKQALNYHLKALPLSREVDYKPGIAVILNNIGGAYHNLGETEQAFNYYNEALELSQTVNDQRGMARTLSNVGSLYRDQRNYQLALDFYNRALPLREAVGDKAGLATTLNQIGMIYAILRDYQQALNYFEQALSLQQGLGDQASLANTLSNIGFIYGVQSNYEESWQYLEQTINLIENIRGSISNSDLKTTYFSTVQDYYGFSVDLLMNLRREKEAFNVSERSRTRTLVELIVESNSEIRDTELSAELRKREQELERNFRALETRRVTLLSRETTDADLEVIGQEYESLLRQQSDLASDIRQANPAYASISYPEPLTVEQIQQDVLDDETVLLQYSLGNQQSYLWVVSDRELQSYLLPPKAEIEQVVQEFREQILEVSGNDAEYINQLGKALAQKVLPLEAMSTLQGNRLVIAADGVLQTLPFAALPDLTSTAPDNEYVPLIEAHEIVNIPSATAIATQRQEIIRQQQQGNRNSSKVLAAIANPVFETPNATRATESAPTTESAIPTTLEAINLELEQRAAERSLQNFRQPPQLDPLPNTETVATAILDLVSNPGQTTKRLRYEANQDWVTQAPLNQYRYLFFGTHGFADNINPELSFIALSLFNEQGQPIDGYLRLNEIFNLKLAADVVVLNACQTGLGRDMRGEGLIGLTRGFMYAGAKTIVASLWDVSATPETTELMTSFFAQLLRQDGSQPPTSAAALRSAQLKLREKEPNNPNYWAAFTIQGDWR